MRESGSVGGCPGLVGSSKLAAVVVVVRKRDSSLVSPKRFFQTTVVVSTKSKREREREGKINKSNGKTRRQQQQSSVHFEVSLPTDFSSLLFKTCCLKVDGHHDTTTTIHMFGRSGNEAGLRTAIVAAAADDGFVVAAANCWQTVEPWP